VASNLERGQGLSWTVAPVEEEDEEEERRRRSSQKPISFEEYFLHSRKPKLQGLMLINMAQIP
jgi:hypothetical protein